MDDAATSAANRRKRGLGMVTPNACVECRKKRAKCDGENPCGRCASQGVSCQYEIPVRQSKEMMRTEIEKLQKHRRNSERVLRAVSESQHEELQFIIDKLKSGMDLAELSERLDEAETKNQSNPWKDSTTFSTSDDAKALQTVLQAAQQLGNLPPLSSERDISPSRSVIAPELLAESGWPQWQDTSQFGLGSNNTMPDPMAWMPSQEGSVIDPSQASASSPHAGNRTDTLVASWVHRSNDREDIRTAKEALATNRSKGHNWLFPSAEGLETQSPSPSSTPCWTKVTDDKELVDHLMALYFCWEYPTFASFSKEHFLDDFRAGRPRYCSELLVNAILALGCRYSSHPEALADSSSSGSAGDHFFAEAKDLLDQQQVISLTTIQALGLMSIREGSCGRDANSLFYCGQSIKLAVEMGLHRNFKVSTDNSGDWDADTVVQSSTFWGALSLDQAWSLVLGRIPHVTTYLPLIAKPPIISEIEGSEWIPYTDDGMPLARYCEQPSNVRSVFQCFCELAEIIQDSLYLLYAPGKRFDTQRLLSVYARHLRWYDNLPVVLRLGHNFTPSVLFVHMYYHTSILLLFRPFIKLRMVGSSISPREICSQCADTIAGLVSSFKQLYTLRRTPCFLPYLILTGAVTHLIVARDTGNLQPAIQAANTLNELSTCHTFAYRAICIMDHLATKWGVPLNLGEIAKDSKKKLAQFIGAKEVTSLLSSSVTLFTSGTEDLESEFSRVGLDGESYLFSPFPLQGLPQFHRVENPGLDGFIFDGKGKQQE